MSADNAGAAIGLSNDNKLTVIGELVPNEPDPRAGVSSYIGNDCTDTWWDHNAISEDVGFLVPSNNGSYLQWVTTGDDPVTLGAEGRVTATNGVIVADAGGDLEAFFPPGTVIPAGTYLWVESGEIPPIEFDDGDPIPPILVVEDVPITPIDITSHWLNGPPPKVYSIFSGSLPPGLAMNSAGIISGTPTTPGVGAGVVFRGSDNAGNHANSNSVVFTVATALAFSGPIPDQSYEVEVVDPLWASVVLLLRGNNFTDLSTQNQTIVFAGAGAADPAIVSNKIRTVANSKYIEQLFTFAAASEEFCIECYLSYSNSSNDVSPSIWPRYAGIAAGNAPSTDKLGFLGSPSNPSAQLNFYNGITNGNNWADFGILTQYGQRVHYAIIRRASDNKWYNFINGIPGTGGVSSDTTACDRFRFGCFSPGNGTQTWDFDNIRATKGSTRYDITGTITAGVQKFVPDASPFPAS